MFVLGLGSGLADCRIRVKIRACVRVSVWVRVGIG